ncbi:MAG: S1 RNA-binding domain-containing protein [Candidatus Parcubacteria bacterium]|nr:S1 RNA-binding domain-containing protein [Candidatus Parcubacteria bacterium]
MEDQNNQQANDNSEFAKLIADNQYLKLPKVGDVIKVKVISASKAEVKLDFEGIKTGIVRGRELFNESDEYGHLKPDEMVEATVIEMENENGEMELSFRFAGQQRAWDSLRDLMKKGEVLSLKITDANKGGLMLKIGNVTGFLPVSQLIPEHYPRVEGGDKAKILEFLRKFINTNLQVKVLDVDEKEEKLIVSEKAAWEEVQEKAVSQYKVGDKIKGKITAVTDFGAFVEFGTKMEGLVHISELAWQRIDDPRDIVKLGDQVEAEIINIEGTKIFLSMKKLQKDPWDNINEKYNVGDMVDGKVLKVNPFGLFVELDADIHGLAHISELSDKPITDVNEIAKAGQTIKFRIISIEPKDHRLGLSLKAPKEPSSAQTATEGSEGKKSKAEEKKIDDVAEEKAEKKEKKALTAKAEKEPSSSKASEDKGKKPAKKPKNK